MIKHPLETIKWGVIPIVNYKGRLITKVYGGYKFHGKFFRKPQDVDKEMERLSEVINKSIVKLG